VGNAESRTGRSWPTPVHPHGRGERRNQTVYSVTSDGSSPRAWGTHYQHGPESAPGRFIPTGVGNAYPSGFQRRNTPGSSPRAWGTPPAARWPCARRRFIPTGVGNASRLVISSADSSVHPHGRGERPNFAPMSMAACGSSPRAWGTLQHDTDNDDRTRFIPTGVGNATSPPPPASCTTVHPHGRGERAKADQIAQNQTGSSPRAWGTHGRYRRRGRWRRFIPTGVGNASAIFDFAAAASVHPHGRGERPS